MGEAKNILYETCSCVLIFLILPLGKLPVEVDMNVVDIVENTEPAPPPLPQRSNEEEGELEEEMVAMLTIGRGKNISYEMTKTRVPKKKPVPMPSSMTKRGVWH